MPFQSDPRKKVWELAGKDVDEALAYARTISDDWYRSQSLAFVAWHTRPKSTFVKIASEALKSASRLPNPNRIVSCSAWIVNAMAERDDVDVSETVDHLLGVIDQEDNPVRRADALLLLFEAIYSRKEIRPKVFSKLIQSASEMKSWKKPRLLSEIALVVAIDSPTETAQILAMIESDRTRQKTEQAIASGAWLGPHEFFPHYKKTTEAHPVR